MLSSIRPSGFTLFVSAAGNFPLISSTSNLLRLIIPHLTLIGNLYRYSTLGSLDLPSILFCAKIEIALLCA